LRVPVRCDPSSAEHVEQVARTIAAGLGAELMELAREIAEAEVDLLRVRRVRNERMWARGIESLVDDPPAVAELALFHRYERRALSRRKTAIRAFLAACAVPRTRAAVSMV
jgi:hypothetical protein